MNLAKSLYNELFHFADRVESILESHNFDSDDIVYVKFFFKTFTPEQLMEHVVNKMLPWKKQIIEKDDNFFYKNKEIFGQLPSNKVNYFSDLWMSNHLDNDDREEIWEFFETFITYAEEFKKKK